MDISKIDSNFKIVEGTEDGLSFYDAANEPFRVHGLILENGIFYRVPQEVAKATSAGVTWLSKCTTGGRVRFITDSSVITVRAEMDPVGKMPHFALTGTAGMDLYVDEGAGEQYVGTFRPPYEIEDGFSSTLNFSGSRKRLVTVNLPIYSGIKRLLIGVSEGAALEAAPDYTVATPVVFYGSSITQACCASRPGTSYQAVVSRLLDCDYINLGFSGNAKGEESIAEYIAGLDMSAFVLDYDHNAPSCEHLEATHERMYKIIREKHPDIPILMLSRPVPRPNEDEKKRIEIIRRTYENAKAAGDEKVMFVEGGRLLDERISEIWSVDGCHPNDVGFASMGYSIVTLLKGMM